jgi:argininosuccinate lyase
VELNELTLEELRAFGSEFGEDFFAALTLKATLDCHDVTGGTARGRVRAALEVAAKHVAALTANIDREAVHAGT